jgi:hypothetical protein
MESRRTKIFFYGLLMDVDLLRSKGTHPIGTQPASVPGYQLRIGQKASLVQHATSSAHGVVAQLADGSYLPALCFNLVTLPAPGEAANPDYAVKWRALAARLELPAAYIEGVG